MSYAFVGGHAFFFVMKAEVRYELHFSYELVVT